MWSQDTPAGMALAVSAAERDDLRAQLSAAVEAKTRAEGDAAALREAWQVYIDEYGLEHEGEEGGPDEDWSECPQDDTCSCPIVNKIRAALAPSAGSALLEEMKRKDEEIARLTKQRDDLRAANWDEVLADRTAERDEARREYQELGSSLDDVTDERDAARAEVAKLTRERDDARDSANIATGDLHCSWNALEKARAELAKLTRERDEAMVTRDSLLVELWEGVRAHGLWAPKQGRDGERLIHAYCGGIAKLRPEVEDARAALDAERKAHEDMKAQRFECAKVNAELRARVATLEGALRELHEASRRASCWHVADAKRLMEAREQAHKALPPPPATKTSETTKDKP
jgi:uncharacterized coiled-coil DUF342 family protein